MKKILILGHGGHGKDTVAFHIANKLKYDYTEPSFIIAERFLFPMFGVYMGYSSAYKMFVDRVNHRVLWGEVMAAINFLDPAKITKEVLSKQNMYVGIRRVREYEASKHFFDVILWVDASKRLPLEPTSSMEFITPPPEAIVIDNNGDKQLLMNQIPWDLLK